jgi:hypothetical protein
VIEAFGASISAILPIFLIIMAGLGLRESKIMPAESWTDVNRITFNVLAPMYVLDLVARADISGAGVAKLSAALVLGVVIMALGALATRPLLKRNEAYACVFQSAVRWNGVMILAAAPALMGPEGTAMLALAFAPITLTANVMAVIGFNLWGGRESPRKDWVMSFFMNPLLLGCTQINLFFEASTRTQSSFELAGKRLGADVMNMSVGNSSVKKGETLIDTAMTLNAMRPDVLVVRHPPPAPVALLAQKVDCSVVNAGDGQHEHPTQALLDALTIRRAQGQARGLTVAICGDVLHSAASPARTSCCSTPWARACASSRRRRCCPRASPTWARGLHRHGGRAEGRRRRDDAAPAARAHVRRLRAVDARIFPLSTASTPKS